MESTLAEMLPAYDATAIADAIRLRKLSASEVVEAHFERIEALNRKLNAIVTLDRDQAMRSAREADRAIERGAPLGPLHGVPVTIKDAFDTAGLRTTVGCRRYRDLVPDRDAWAVRRLKESGAIVIAKTNCAKLCGDMQTSNELFGRTNNPWDVARTAGGSSGGEAAAVAVGMSPLGLASDTGGSIRVPSSYCGVFGLKTSLGKIPRDGLRPHGPDSNERPDSLTTIGVITRSVRDLRLAYSVLADEHPVSTMSRPPRLLWTHEFDGQPVDDEISRTLADKLKTLMLDDAEVLQAPSPIPLGRLFGLYLRLCMFEFTPKEGNEAMYYAYRGFERLRSAFRGGMAREYARLKRRQRSLAMRVHEFIGDRDCWVLPATPCVAFPHRRMGMSIRMHSGGSERRFGYWQATMGLTYPINLAGNPSVVVPVGLSSEGMPIALQVVGKMGEDVKLLEVADYLTSRIGKAIALRRGPDALVPDTGDGAADVGAG